MKSDSDQVFVNNANIGKKLSKADPTKAEKIAGAAPLCEGDVSLYVDYNDDGSQKNIDADDLPGYNRQKSIISIKNG